MNGTRRLVVNADDFGLTPGVNAGIIDAHRHGIVTSASVFANAAATAEALALARRTPALGLGCHLTLVDGEPLSPLSAIPSLVRDGRFRATWASFAAAVAAGRVRLAEIERELGAQIERVRSGGLRLSHLDGHKHIHVCPPIFAIVTRLAKRFGIPRVRVPWERPAGGLVVRYGRIAGARRQALENLALSPWALADRRRLAADGFVAAPRFLGRVLTGLLDCASFPSLLAEVPVGITELMVHPGYADAALDAIRTRLRDARAREVDLLIAHDTWDAVARAHVTLVNHHADSEPHRHGS